MNIIDVTNYSKNRIPAYGNAKKYIVIHYLGVVGQNNRIEANGCGAHYYIYWDGTTYQACPDGAIVYQVGTASGAYRQLHPYANNSNCIGIEMCVKCDGNTSNPRDPYWYFTEETQKAAVELVKHLMKKYNIPIENIIRHGDVVNKWCPAPYMNNKAYKTSWTWETFKNKVKDSSTTTVLSNRLVIAGQKALQTIDATVVADGVKGSHTVKTAIKHLQKALNNSFKEKLVVDGIWGQATQKAIYKHYVQRGDFGQLVTTLQILLCINGYNPNGIDGVFGDGCVEALKKFQKEHKLTVDDVAGGQTFYALCH